MNDNSTTEWVEQNNRLEKMFQFETFADAMSFMLRVSYECEKMDHHPAWRNIYTRVWVSLCTHSAGDIVTDKDRVLATTMDSLFNQISR